MSTNAYLDHSTIKCLLQISVHSDSQTEEQRHHWVAYPSIASSGHLPNHPTSHSSVYEELHDEPLLRVWDWGSGSRPDTSSGNRMLARSPKGILSTRAQRKTSLTLHADYDNREPTPYISFTGLPDVASQMANFRLHKRKRDNQHIIAIDPRNRLQRGLPILDVGKEMAAYDVQNPYRYDYFYEGREYLCLWEVSPCDVVGTWRWDDLCNNDRWYENIIMPAFRSYRAQQDAKSESMHDRGLSTILTTGRKAHRVCRFFRLGIMF
jgi:hypothetical protein